MAPLEEYRQKRNFDKTSEPEGLTEPADQEEELHFVVHHHLARRDHYDLRLEWNGVLLSWAVPKGPSFNPQDKRLAIRVEDHPLEYRHFEGTIPKGEYGGGTVMLWDEGYWIPLGNVETGLREGSLKFVLKGARLKGKWALVRMKGKEEDTKDNWLWLKEKDEYARTEEGIAEFTTSVRTGRTMEQIEQGTTDHPTPNPFSPAEAQFMLAKPVSRPPEGEDWLYEIKYDGYRIMAFIQGQQVQLITRNGHDYAHRFGEVTASLRGWAAGRSMVLDGEMVVIDQKGRTDFQALQHYGRTTEGRLTYIVFDLLALDGADWRDRPLIQRKQRLASLMEQAPASLYYSKHIEGNGAECLQAACQMQLEGIIGKKAHSLYSGNRSGDWVKLKCQRRQEFVIGGYTQSEARDLSALLLGVYDGDQLIYVGRAGTGFTERIMAELKQRFAPLKRDTSPFQQPPKLKGDQSIVWLEPLLVAEIQYAELTKDRQLRQASFKGLRHDKPPKEIQMDSLDKTVTKTHSEPASQPETAPPGGPLVIGGITISHPDKVIFEQPRTTKADVVRYYAAVAERMLPHIRCRILSIVRCPKGVAEACFFKKHPGPGSKGVVTVPILSSKGETEEYFYIEEPEGLIAEAQMGTLEFHVWGSRVDHLEQPDLMVFDLDPDEGMPLDQVRQGVRDLKHILDELSLQCYLKTSGGKGYHVVVPFTPSADWDAFYQFARQVAEVMEKTWPDRYTTNVRKEKRKNKIFIDWIRNGRGATSVAPYSLRAREGATVSMPIRWDELDTVAPGQITMAQALERLDRPDPWQDFWQVQQQLKI